MLEHLNIESLLIFSMDFIVFFSNIFMDKISIFDYNLWQDQFFQLLHCHHNYSLISNRFNFKKSFFFIKINLLTNKCVSARITIFVYEWCLCVDKNEQKFKKNRDKHCRYKRLVFSYLSLRQLFQTHSSDLQFIFIR